MLPCFELTSEFSDRDGDQVSLVIPSRAVVDDGVVALDVRKRLVIDHCSARLLLTRGLVLAFCGSLVLRGARRYIVT